MNLRYLYILLSILATSCKSDVNDICTNKFNDQAAIEYCKKIIINGQLKNDTVVFPTDSNFNIIWKEDTAFIKSTYKSYNIDSTITISSNYKMTLLCKDGKFINLGKTETYIIENKNYFIDEP